MRTSSEELSRFYATPLGAVALETLTGKVKDGWGELSGLRLASFGFGRAVLDAFPAAERSVSLMPAAAGPMGDAGEVVVEEASWPLRDASVDRLLVLHGLEECPDPRKLLREAWRVLTDDGRMIVIAANRHGFWTLFENSPFAAGRAWSQRRLFALLGDGLFAPTAKASALYFPPARQVVRFAPLWERTAGRLEPLGIPLPNIAGVVLVEARRSMAAPVSGSKAEVFGPLLSGQRTPSRGLAAGRNKEPR
jgi:SAM-dependent methyltransferase